MTMIVEDHVGGRKISYDPVKFHRFLPETLINRRVLTRAEIDAFYRESQ